MLKLPVRPFPLTDFAQKIAEPAMEGGLTTEEYLQLYKTDLDSEMEVLGLALAIEVQALDLYSRAAEKSRARRVPDGSSLRLPRKSAVTLPG